MNIAQYSIQHRVVSGMLILVLLIGGSVSFFGLGQLEFPEFSIKKALVITAYPGASPEQVEEEVSLPLEEILQQMSQVKHITSINSAGLSQIEVEMRDGFDKHKLPQIWDELRRKVADAQPLLPSGAQPSLVMDDFGDVYGYLFNLTGPGYSYRELERYGDLLRRELALLPEVRKVSVVGVPQEEILVEISQQTLKALGQDPAYLFTQIQAQNVVSHAGKLQLEDNRIRIHPTGEFSAVQDVENLLISPRGSGALVRLGDIAKVYKATEENPAQLYRADQQRAISIGVAFRSGVNVVDASARVRERLEQFEPRQPLGMSLQVAYDQGAQVDNAVSGFLTNLFQAVAIVIAVLMLFMGLRAGLLMGMVLLLNILATFMVMNLVGLQLQMISLGALIIALGMLVDNAIVITEGVLIGLQRGQTRLQAARNIVSQTQWPLLGATVIAIVAFAPIGLSKHMTGEFAGSLFWVLMIALSFSWILALTITPFLCTLFFKEPVLTENRFNGRDRQMSAELYQGRLFSLFRLSLSWVLRHRKLSLGLVLCTLLAGLFGMQQVKLNFIPPSNTPIVLVNQWMQEGAGIQASAAQAARVEAFLFDRQARQDFGLVNITTSIGRGAQRFMLPYEPEKGFPAYAQLIVNIDSLENRSRLLQTLTGELRHHFPEADYRVQILNVGPTPAAKLEARFFGEDPAVLRALAAEAEAIMRAEPLLDNVRHNWRNQVPVVRPEFNQLNAAQAGISKASLDSSLQMAFDGVPVASYREGSQVIPVLARAPESERQNPDSLRQRQIWSQEYQAFVPLGQVVDGVEVVWENPIIYRRDRSRVISVLSDPLLTSDATTDSLLKAIRGPIEAIDLPVGYRLEWGGEYEVSNGAQEALIGSVPLAFLAMFLITVLLFNSVRQPVIIWLMVPLSVVGVSAGLLLLDAPMSFMATLGLLSLSGMLIKNGIVLVDQIKLELSQGREPYQALLEATVSRVRPVTMAALTTVLGMLPLLANPFFKSMAVVIISGLSFATVLTLVVLPLCYALLYGIRVPGAEPEPGAKEDNHAVVGPALS